MTRKLRVFLFVFGDVVGIVFEVLLFSCGRIIFIVSLVVVGGLCVLWCIDVLRVWERSLGFLFAYVCRLDFCNSFERLYVDRSGVFVSLCV